MKSLRDLAPDLLRGVIKPQTPLHEWVPGRYQNSATHGDMTAFKRRMELYRMREQRNASNR